MSEKEKILYISTVEDGRPYQGVKKKVAMQCRAFEKNGFHVTALNYGRRSTFGQIEKLLLHSYGINYRSIKNDLLKLDADSYEYCYVRYAPATRGLIDVLKTVKETQKNIKVILEIPTYPYEEEFKSLKAKPSMLRERLYRMKMKQYVDIVVTPSNAESDEIFGIPAYGITNGIEIESIKPRTIDKKTDNSFNILGVALITEKQGFDRVIRGISEYLKDKKTDEPEVYFYVVGDGDYKRPLENLADELGVKEYVIFTGQKEPQELEEYYSLADIGIGTLGLYKTANLKRANSLKTREYCAKGVPFVIADCDYIFVDYKADFCKVVPNDDSPIDIRNAITFIQQLNQKYDYAELQNEMISFANRYLSWTTILKDVIKIADNQ